MTDHDRISVIEERLQVLEDQAAIAQIVSSYGPLADSCQGDRVRDLWVETGGSYELQGWFFTSEEMAGTVTTDLHERFVANGSAHTLGPPSIWLHGDTAVAVNYSVVFVHHDPHWVPERVAANRWDLVRTEAGWRVRRRVNRLLDGGAEAIAILSGAEPPPYPAES